MKHEQEQQKVEHWQAHTGDDYTVVMADGECTDNASIRVYGPHAKELGEQIAKRLNVSGDLLAKAWGRYERLFGVVPHGTRKQMAALLELIP